MRIRASRSQNISGVSFGAPLITSGFIDTTRLTFSRSQPSNSVSTGVSSDGFNWNTFAADVPRFVGTARRLLIGGQRTNGIRNPRFLGTVAGSPGTLPTNSSLSSAAGLSREIVGVFTEYNVTYIRFRITGTHLGVTEALALDFLPDINSIAGFTQGVFASTSMFVRLAAGSLPASSGGVRLVIEERDASSTVSFRSNNITITGALQRYSYSVSAANGASLNARGRLWVYINPGAVCDFTLDIGWPQTEIGSITSTPILPAPNTSLESTRGGDFITASGSKFSSLFPNLTSGTIFACFNIQNVTSSEFQNLIQVDNGTGANRYLLRLDPSVAEIRLYRVTNGAGSSAQSGGVAVSGNTFAVGMTFDTVAGTSNISVNGAAVVGQSSGPTSVNILRIGSSINTQNLFGEISFLRTLPFAVSNSELQSYTSSLPL